MTGTMHHTHDFDARDDLTIENKIATDDRVAKIRRNVGPYGS